MALQDIVTKTQIRKTNRGNIGLLMDIVNKKIVMKIPEKTGGATEYSYTF